MTEKKGKLPIRVKGGTIHPEHLFLETAEEIIEVPWEKIKLLSLGVIEEKVGMEELPRSFIRNVLRSIFYGEKMKEVRKTYLLDIFVEGAEVPFRLDSSFINYRSFLPRPSHISIQNFKKLLNIFVHQARDSRLALSLVAFLCGRMTEVKGFGSIYDYEIELENIKNNLGLQVPQCEVELTDFWETEDETAF